MAPSEFLEWLDTISGPICAREVNKATWRRMQAELGIPFGGQGGMKLPKPANLGRDHAVTHTIIYDV